jgi:hypothetical protein
VHTVTKSAAVLLSAVSDSWLNDVYYGYTVLHTVRTLLATATQQALLSRLTRWARLQLARTTHC